MRLVAMYQASKFPGAPTRQTLSSQSKRQNKPEYFHKENGRWKIDVENEAWGKLLNKRIGKRVSELQRGGLQRGTRSASSESKNDLQLELLRGKVRENDVDVQTKVLKLKKESKEVIDFALAEYLFLGFIDRMAREKLELGKKIEHRIELEIQAAKKARRTSKTIARDITKLVMNEEERIIRETKKAQIEDLNNWRDEEGLK